VGAIVFLRHGILSSAERMADLGTAIAEASVSKTRIEVNNKSYPWRNSVLLNGIELATQVRDRIECKDLDHVVLVGHSQGGLVCRVAAAALSSQEGLQQAITKAGYIDGRYRCEAIKKLKMLESPEKVAQKLRGVITLATPNSGAMTFGQLALSGKIALGIAQLIGAAGIAVNLADLTTDRLFRILQHVKVRGIRYLSISGSAVNRFSFFSPSDLSEIPLASRLGVHLKLPNDWIVEDESANIENAVLPPEIADVQEQYEHIRWYPDCSQVTHPGVHANSDVRHLVIRRIQQWCDGYCQTDRPVMQ
jgi:pimeloyl-ACP methyl ester carboxylesterase